MTVSHPGSSDPLLAAFDRAGVVSWVLTGGSFGASTGDDTMSAVDCSMSSNLCVAGGSVPMHAAFSCTASTQCSAATATIVWLHGDPSTPPSTASSLLFGGHGIAAATARVVTRGDTITVIGTASRAAGTTDSGVLFIPDRVGVASGGATVTVPSADQVVWLAHYTTTAGVVRLAWVSALHGDTGSVSIDDAVASSSGLVACGASDATSLTTSWAVPAAGVSAATLTGLPSVANSTHTLVRPSSGRALALALPADIGDVQWLQWVESDAEVTCSSLSVRAGVVVAAGDVLGSYIGIGSEQLPVVAGETTMWGATLNAATGSPLGLQALGSVHVSGTSSRDHAAAVVLDASSHTAFIVANSAGGELRSYVHGDDGSGVPSTAFRLAGTAARPATASSGSSDVVAFAWPLPTGGADAADVVPMELPGGAWTASPAAGLGTGEVLGVSVGRRHVVTVGAFKGDLLLDASGALTASSEGSVLDTTHGSDPLLVIHDAASVDAEPRAALPLFGTGIDANDVYSDTAASPDGRHHYVVGYAAAGAAGAAVAVGDEVAILAGDGGRDGFIFAVSDIDASVVWMREVGSVATVDDVLTCVATGGTLLAAGGQITGAIPTWGTRSIYSDAVEDRQLAIVYIMSAHDGTEDWAKAFGTDTTDGTAVVASVAVHVTTDGIADGIVVAGSFTGGNLVVDDEVLDAPEDAPLAQTGFVVMLDAETGAVRWARRATTVGGVPSSQAFSTVSSVDASAAAVAVAGSFIYPGTGRLAFEQSMLVEGVASNEDVEHGYVAVFDATTGASLSVTVPQCTNGCEAAGIAIRDGHAAAAFTYTRTLAVVSGAIRWSLDEDWAGPHAAVLILGGLGGADVLGLQRISAGRGHSLKASAVAFGTGLAGTMAVAGWRDGSLALRDTKDRSLRFPAAPFQQPLMATFGSTSRRVLAGPESHLAVPVLFGNSASSSGSPLHHAVSNVAAALGANTALTAVTYGNAAMRGDHGDELGTTVGDNTTATDSVLVATQRGSGSELWTWRIGGPSRTLQDGISGTAASPDGSVVCATGFVGNASHIGVLPDEWGVNVEDPDTVGAGDAFVACFDDKPALGVPHHFPRWTRLLATRLYQSATTISASDEAVFVGFQSADSIEFASGNVPTSLRPGVPCVIGSLNATDGMPMTGMFFGGSDSSDTCRVNGIAVTHDATLVCAVGTYKGDSLPISAAATLYPIDSSKASAFVVCYTGPNNGGAGPYTLAWASGSQFDAATYLPEGDTAAAATGIEVDADRVYVTGLYYSTNIEWGSDTGAGLSTHASADVQGDADPATAYVAAFDRLQPESIAHATWVSSLPSTEWNGILSAGGVAKASHGRVLAAVTTSAPVVVSPFAAPAAARVGIGATGGAGTYTVIAALDVASGAYLDGHVIGDPSADLAILSQVAAATLTKVPSLHSSHGLGDGIVLAGAARGELRSSRATTGGANAAVMSAHTAGDFVVFHAGAGAAEQASGDGVSLINTDASLVADLRSPAHAVGSDGRYVVQFEAWRSHGGAAIAGGSWRSESDHGPGVTFTVSPRLRAAQVSQPGQWVLIEAEVTAALHGAGSHFGSVGGDAMLQSLRVLTLRTDATNTDVSAQWRVRNIRLVPRSTTCVPCGQVPVRREAVSLERPAVGVELTGSIVELQLSDPTEPLLKQPVDATTIVDPACDCLQGVVLEWEQRAGGLHIEGVALSPFPGSGSGIKSMDIVTEPATEAGWDKVTCRFGVEHQRGLANVDWQALSSLTMYTSVPSTAVNGTVAGQHTTLRELVLRRPCPKTDIVLHPRPNEVGTNVDVTRTSVKMERGQKYRILTIETNMFGQEGLPICSSPFIADDTPPEVGAATVFDLDASDVARIKPRVDVASTSSSQLRLAWDGSFADPDSDVAGVLRYRISQVAIGSVAGSLLPDVTSEEKLLPIVSSDDVTTDALALQDGETYHAFLDVCNVRTRVCTCAPTTLAVTSLVRVFMYVLAARWAVHSRSFTNWRRA